MQKMPLVRTNKTRSMQSVKSSDDILRIQWVGEKQMVIHTANNEYELDLSMEAIEQWLFEEGFRKINADSLVNIDHIQHYDERNQMVYLGDPSSPEVKTASVAPSQQVHVHNLIKLKRHPALNLAKLELSATDPFIHSYTSFQTTTAKKQQVDQLHYLAYHDTVTGLPNRQLFREALQSEIVKAEANQLTGAVIFIDLDRFKFINDTLGHLAGDELLRLIAQRLVQFSTNQIISRFGGDEFVILVPSTSSRDSIDTYIHGIRELFEKPFQYEDQDLYISTSIGISLYPKDGQSADELIQYADNAMFHSKENGRNQTNLFLSESNARFRNQLQMESDLRSAITRQEFALEYQPLVDIENGKITGMEALVRWHHPEKGIIPPLDFIPLAEDTGLIIPIGQWVLREACQQTAQWHQRGYSELKVSVNISAKQFQQPGFLDSIVAILAETGLPASSLCIELTESVAMSQAHNIVELMLELKALGLQIAIDDFGTGYSSLSYLRRFRVHVIKFDRSFIKDITVNADDAAIVDAMITMSKQLNIRTVAEGVETEEQLDHLRNNGCMDMQGYLFSKPINAELFWKLLNEHHKPA